MKVDNEKVLFAIRLFCQNIFSSINTRYRKIFTLIYYTTLLKSVQITSKTNTNIQRYSDSWLFVYFRFDEFVFSQSNFVSAAVLHVC